MMDRNKILLLMVALIAAVVPSLAAMAHQQSSWDDVHDQYWMAAMSYVKTVDAMDAIGRRLLIQELPPAPVLPSKSSWTATMDSLWGGDATAFDKQPLTYSIAVDGNNASITAVPDNSTLYFMLDDFMCNPTETFSRSYQVSIFQAYNLSDDGDELPEAQQVCWKAPPGYVIYEGYPPKIKNIISSFVVAQNISESDPGNKFLTWRYAGPFGTGDERADLFMRTTSVISGSGARDTGAISVLAYRQSDGIPLYYQTKVVSNNAEGQAAASEFSDAAASVTATVRMQFHPETWTVYGDDEEVPMANVPPEMKEEGGCLVMQPGYNTMQCQGGQDMTAAQAAARAIADSRNEQAKGNDPNATTRYPDTGKPYVMQGTEEEQAYISNNLTSFLPSQPDEFLTDAGYVGRPLNPVRDQGSCGSCYSFATAEVISAAVNMRNNGTTHYVFSNQWFMDCAVLSTRGGSGGVPPVLNDAGSGCWGGNARPLMDMLVARGGMLPTIEQVTYIGFQGTCPTNLSADDMIDTGITGYSLLTTNEQIKNALVFVGDVAISTGTEGWGGDWVTPLSWPSFLGHGLSQAVGAEAPVHAITIVGWGQCQVPKPLLPDYPCGGVPGGDEYEYGECWIVQNSWGSTGPGYQGYIFINTDPACNYGILANGAAVPRFD